jgi:FAD/FMN-containing dehydrogenase
MATRNHDKAGLLSRTFKGSVLRADDDGYDEARAAFNGLVDKRPALILRCRDTVDIVDAVGIGRESGMEVAIRGGGHNIAGRGTTEGGVLIDLSLMKEIVIDPGSRIARVGPGATWADFNDAAAAYGLATTGGTISTTGVAGLTLGGGFGWLMGSHGLAADNLHAVELVTADGSVLRVDGENHPDLFWAIRGGGGNFGVVALFEFRLHPVREVYAGLVVHPFEAASDVLRFCREFAASLPDELGLMPLLVHAPDGSGAPVVAVGVCHGGAPERAQADLEPLLTFGSPLLSQVGPVPYPAVNTMLDAGFPPGRRYNWKSSFMPALSDEAIEVLVRRFAECPSPMTGVAIEHFHGAVTRVPVTATAVPHRDPSFNVLIASGWDDPASDEANIAWTRATYQELEPFFTDRRYVNYLSADDGQVRSAYGANYDRLAQIKARYDPRNLFRLNHNIEPALAIP